MKHLWGALLITAAAGCGSQELTASTYDAELAALGKQVFEDETLSSPAGESCGTCHDPAHAFTDPRGPAPTSEGAVAGRFGNRNAPSVAYAGFSPRLRYSSEDGTWVGGQFWDGRAATLVEQAQGPLLNPLEMNNASIEEVVGKLSRARYAPAFRALFGEDVFADPRLAIVRMGEALQAFEQSREVSPFTSKFDAVLRGEATFTDAEARGKAVFEDANKGNCAACHPDAVREDGGPPLFTDFTYDNLGVPRNPDNPFYGLPSSLDPEGAQAVDVGLAATTGNPDDRGRFKVPTLRNLGRSAPYFHNGYFRDLRSVVDFYNTRDVKDWPAPEIPETVNHTELGNLGLTDAEVDDLLAFLGTLDDGYTAAR